MFWFEKKEIQTKPIRNIQMYKYNYSWNRLKIYQKMFISVLIDNRMFPLYKALEIYQQAAASKLMDLGFFPHTCDRHLFFISSILIPYVKDPVSICILMPHKKSANHSSMKLNLVLASVLTLSTSWYKSKCSHGAKQKAELPIPGFVSLRQTSIFSF